MKFKGIDMFIKDMLSGRGNISCKRTSGIITLLSTILCTIYLVITEGGSNTVETLVQTLIISAVCLLGASSVTGIFKTPKPTKKDPPKDQIENL